MAKETIDAVRNAEIEADAAVKNATKEAADIVKAAEKKAAEIKQQAEKEATLIINTKREKSEQNGKIMISSAADEAKKACEELATKARLSEDQAAAEILKHLNL